MKSFFEQNSNFKLFYNTSYDAIQTQSYKLLYFIYLFITLVNWIYF